MLDHIVLNLTVAVEAEIISCSGDFLLRHDEASSCARVVLFRPLALFPAGKRIREIVELRLVLGQFRPGAEFILRHEEIALIVEA